MILLYVSNTEYVLFCHTVSNGIVWRVDVVTLKIVFEITEFWLLNTVQVVRGR